MVVANPKNKNYFKEPRMKCLVTTSKNEKKRTAVRIAPMQENSAMDLHPLHDQRKKHKKMDESSRKHHLERSHHRPFDVGTSSLSSVFLGQDLQLSDKVSFSLSSIDKELLRLAPPQELLSAFMELSARAMLLGQRMGSELVKGSVEVEKLNKELADSSRTLKETLDANTLLSHKIKELETEHARLIEDESSWRERCLLAEENEKKLELKKQSLKQSLADMTLSLQVEQGKRMKAEEELLELQQHVLDKYEEGFNKALRQAAFFYKIPLNEGNFDVGKEFYNDELVPVEEIPNDEENFDSSSTSSSGTDDSQDSESDPWLN